MPGNVLEGRAQRAEMIQTDVRDDSDPDIYVWQGDRRVAFGIDDVPTEPLHTETVDTMTLAAGDYAVELIEYRYVDELTASDFPSQVCYDVTIVAL